MKTALRTSAWLYVASVLLVVVIEIVRIQLAQGAQTDGFAARGGALQSMIDLVGLVAMIVTWTGSFFVWARAEGSSARRIIILLCLIFFGVVAAPIYVLTQRNIGTKS